MWPISIFKKKPFPTGKKVFPIVFDISKKFKATNENSQLEALILTSKLLLQEVNKSYPKDYEGFYMELFDELVKHAEFINAQPKTVKHLQIPSDKNPMQKFISLRLIQFAEEFELLNSPPIEDFHEPYGGYGIVNLLYYTPLTDMLTQPSKFDDPYELEFYNSRIRQLRPTIQRVKKELIYLLENRNRLK